MNEVDFGEGGGEAKKRKRRARVVDAIRHFHSEHVIISADRGRGLRTPDGYLRKARCMYTRIAPRG